VLLPVVRPKRQHEYALCQDEDCPRFPCRVFKEGYAAGYRAGHAAGYAEGYTEGYGEGFSAGVSSAG
jgi:hypothetical protein